jgi:hypothetical protein
LASDYSDRLLVCLDAKPQMESEFNDCRTHGPLGQSD